MNLPDFLSVLKMDISLFFEIHDADIYGGEGSVGYSSVSYNDCSAVKVKDMLVNPEKVEKYLLEQRTITANLLHVPVENVQCITQQEYLEKTDFPDEEDTEDEDY